MMKSGDKDGQNRAPTAPSNSIKWQLKDQFSCSRVSVDRLLVLQLAFSIHTSPEMGLKKFVKVAL
jgi:hypothetical protein